MVDYGGWHMPVEYSGIGDEHLAVRAQAGLFDVSHMGEIEVAGADALRTLQALTCNDVSRLAVGQIQYSALTTPGGTFVDDVLVYRMAEEHYLLVVNATTTRKDYAWMASHTPEAGDVAVVDASARYALLALQGPESPGILQPLTGVDLSALRYYWFATGEVAGVRATISRTGYTGEDGFEIFIPPAQADRVWQAILQSGSGVGVRPCGLGARDTLRLEACMRLYGNDMDESVTVLEAGLGWIVAWEKGPFLGRETLEAQRTAGLDRRLVAFEMVERAIARPGHSVLLDGRAVGTVTSGTRTPFLRKAVGLAMVPVTMTAVGSEFDIDVRGRTCRARVVKEPFYRRPRPARAAVSSGPDRE
jgi:aminomethyltransferase